MPEPAGTARVLLIADDPLLREQYARELEAHAYVVRQASSFIDTLLDPMADPCLLYTSDAADE